jgi:hypothetical protein
LTQIAIKYAEAGQYNQALGLAKTIDRDDCQKKAQVLTEVAVKYVQAEQPGQALKIAQVCVFQGLASDERQACNALFQQSFGSKEHETKNHSCRHPVDRNILSLYASAL